MGQKHWKTGQKHHRQFKTIGRQEKTIGQTGRRSGPLQTVQDRLQTGLDRCRQVRIVAERRILGQKHWHTGQDHHKQVRTIERLDKTSNVNDIETKAERSFDLGFVFDNKAK